MYLKILFKSKNRFISLIIIKKFFNILNLFIYLKIQFKQPKKNLFYLIPIKKIQNQI